jgi:hypothetical protein
MNGPKAILLGLSLICALLVSALAASSATAAELGTTAFTCKTQTNPAAGAVGFSDEHCLNPTTGKDVKFEHVELTPKSDTKVTATNSNTADSTKKSAEFILTGKIGGLNGEIGCTTAHMEGAMDNFQFLPMKVYTDEIKMSFTGCTTKGFLAFIKCKVSKEVIWVKAPSAESKSNTMEVVFNPEVPNKFAFFDIEGCGIEEEYAIEGNPNAIARGATLEFTKDSTSGLSMEGAQASLTGQLTVRMKEEGGKVQDPIATTTQYVP